MKPKSDDIKIVKKRIAAIRAAYAAGEPVTRADRRLAGLPVGGEPGDEAVVGGTSTVAEMEEDKCDTLASIQRKLDLYYRDDRRVRIIISKQLVSDWQKGNRLPEGVPPPPGRIANSRFWSISQWIEWFDKYMFPHLRVGGDGAAATSHDLLARAAQAEAQKKIRDDQRSEFEFDLLRGKYIERAVAKRTVLGALQKMRGMVKLAMERNNTASRRNYLRDLGVAEELLARFVEFDDALAKRIVDDIEQQCEEAGRA